MTDQQRPVAMVIMAHPDDAEFGCAGTIAAWVREGWDAYYVICTDASGGGSDDALDVGTEARRMITETRKSEQRAAGEILGLKDIIFLDHPDGVLMPTIELRREIVRLLRHYRPTRLICQSPDRSWRPQYAIGRYHPDHLAAGQATLSAVYPASQNPWDFPELLAEGLMPHKVREVYVMSAPEVNHAVDITATIDVKLEALGAHTSQVGARMEELVPRLRKFSEENGKLHGMAYAELFNRAENG